MNIDLTSTFKDARQLTNTWKARYSAAEYPQKVIMNIFYRKYTIEKMWSTIFNTKYSSWETAYENLKNKYAEVALSINPVLETKLKANDKVTSIKFSDFTSYIQSASSGNKEALKGIEYTYFLHRIFDELILVWVAMVISGDTKINAIAKITRAVLAEMPINDYAVIEQIFDQLGAEKYLQTLFISKIHKQLHRRTH
jgi:hypothetical protein